MYRQNLDAKDKGGAVIAVLAIHAGLLFLLLHLSGKLDVIGSQSVLQVFDLKDVPPPPPPPPPPRQQQAAPKPKEAQGGSPANIKSQATPVKAPTPRIVIPVPTPMTAAKTPAQGTAPTQGAAAVAGPGTGAGGSGTGNGNGSGSGSGGGGDGGVAEPPHLATPVLTGREIPRELLDRWPRGMPVFLRLRVDPQGYISECNVLRGTGIDAIDGVMCNIAHERLRFQPARNRIGQPVAGWFGYAQRPPR